MGYRNLLPARITAADGPHVLAEGRGLALRATPAAEQPVRAGQDVLVAVRPEDLRIAAKGEPAIGGAVAEIVEYHGRVLHVEAVTSEGVRLHLRAHHPVRPGDALSVAADAERALAFPAPGEGTP
jgi:putative spermidine/putrescine transport system ATP-binding protein